MMTEVESAIKKLKKGKAASSNGIMEGMIRAGGCVLCRWLVRVMNVCWERNSAEGLTKGSRCAGV